MGIIHRKCAFLMVVMVLLSAYTSSAVAEPLLRGNQHNRKMLQWYGRYGGRRGGDSANAQFNRNSAAIVNSQYAIRSAVESGASLPATAGAAYYAQDQAWLAANGWYPYGRWGSWYGRR